MFNAMISLLGIVLGFAGVALTFVTFFAPGLIQELALRNPRRWMPVPSLVEGNKAYRHNILSGFTVNVDFSYSVNEDFFEPWMDALHRPDPSASSHYVTLFFNGMPMDRMLFLQYDGSRNFIPVPIVKRVDDRYYVDFTLRQKQFADIVGRDYFGRAFSEVKASITESRYNPTYLSLPDADLPERLRALHVRIEEYKSRIYKS